MNKHTLILLLFLQMSLILGEKSSLNIGISSGQISTLKDTLVPVIVSKIPGTISIPDFETKKGIFKIYGMDMKGSLSKDISADSVSVSLKEGSNIIVFSMANLRLSFTGKIRAKAIGIRKTVDMTVEVKKVGFSSFLHIARSSDGKLSLAISNVHVHIDEDDVDIELHGGWIDDIIEWVVNLVKGKVVDEVKDAISEQIPQAVNDVLSQILDKIPNQINIYQDLFAKIVFLSNPIVVNQYFTAGVWVYVFNEGDNPPQYEPVDLPQLNPKCEKGMQVFFSDYIIRTGFESAYESQIFTLNYSQEMRGLDVTLNANATNAPTLSFSENRTHVTIEGTGKVKVDNVWLVDSLFMDLKVKMGADVHEDLREGVIYASIEKLNLEEVQITDSSLPFMDWLFNWILDLLVDFFDDVAQELFNSILSDRGIPLPAIKGFDLTDSTDSLEPGYFELCSNIHLDLAKFDFE